MSLKKLLVLQLVYALVGIGYNVVSFALVSMGGEPLSSTAPVTGAIALFAYGLCLIPGAMGYLIPYRILMVLSILVFGYGGIVKHLVNFFSDQLFLYSSTLAWVAAILINVYGLVLNVMAAAGWFKKNVKKG